MLNKNILSVVCKYLDLKTLAELNLKLGEKFFPDTKYIKNRLKYYKNKNFKCVKCNGKLIYHNPDVCEDICGEIDEEKDLYCISTHDNDEEYYICDKCRYYYLCCPECSTEDEKILCQFWGYHGCDKDRKRYRFTNKFLIEKILNDLPHLKKFKEKNILSFCEDDINNIDESYNINEIIYKLEKEKRIGFYTNGGMFSYDVSDLNLEYFDITDRCPTGLDGGYCHFWKCKNCGKFYTDTDL